MKKLLLSVALALAALGSACTTAPQSPEQAVYAIEGGAKVAGTAALGYARLPECSATVSAPCSQREVITQLQKANQVALDSLRAAESAVRTPGVGASAQSAAVAAARAALAALNALVAQFGVTAK